MPRQSNSVKKPLCDAIHGWYFEVVWDITINRDLPPGSSNQLGWTIREQVEGWKWSDAPAIPDRGNALGGGVRAGDRRGDGVSSWGSMQGNIHFLANDMVIDFLKNSS